MMAEVAYIGGYTPDTDGSGPGITLVELGSLARLGETAASGPSFLAVHPTLPILYAVGESERGTIGVFARAGDGTLSPLAQRPSEGSAPCHLAVDPTGTRLAVTNYGDGTVSVHGIDGSGLLTDVWIFPYREGAHAHQAVFGPDGVLYVSDLGCDEVRRYLVGDEVVPHPAGPVRLASGMGPRHMAWSGGHWYVAGELDGTVRVYEVSGGSGPSGSSGFSGSPDVPDGSGASGAPDGGWREIAVVPASGSEGRNQPSHLEVSGGLVYVANRGPDTISVFAGPGLEPVAEVPCGGVWPRHFAAADGHMYVANQRSDGVAVLPLKGGVPQPAEEVFAVGTPSCVLPLP
ncbi:lactonase family protein [Streptosporangium sp. NBC_01469]|uniref:lactonase family protein n=1 Tax=Streptosporangium sp. NBC_01469 TaxID=2903898 RepID=UPI002E2E044A|nr:beta-propeller fold lactonase family protein [Streptosporangium sp. NBC_01469]